MLTISAKQIIDLLIKGDSVVILAEAGNTASYLKITEFAMKRRPKDKQIIILTLEDAKEQISDFCETFVIVTDKIAWNWLKASESTSVSFKCFPVAVVQWAIDYTASMMDWNEDWINNIFLHSEAYCLFGSSDSKLVSTYSSVIMESNGIVFLDHSEGLRGVILLVERIEESSLFKKYLNVVSTASEIRSKAWMEALCVANQNNWTDKSKSAFFHIHNAKKTPFLGLRFCLLGVDTDGPVLSTAIKENGGEIEDTMSTTTIAVLLDSTARMDPRLTEAVSFGVPIADKAWFDTVIKRRKFRMPAQFTLPKVEAGLGSEDKPTVIKQEEFNVQESKPNYDTRSRVLYHFASGLLKKGITETQTSDPDLWLTFDQLSIKPHISKLSVFQEDIDVGGKSVMIVGTFNIVMRDQILGVLHKLFSPLGIKITECQQANTNWIDFYATESENVNGDESSIVATIQFAHQMDDSSYGTSIESEKRFAGRFFILSSIIGILSNREFLPNIIRIPQLVILNPENSSDTSIFNDSGLVIWITADEKKIQLWNAPIVLRMLSPTTIQVKIWNGDTSIMSRRNQLNPLGIDMNIMKAKLETLETELYKRISSPACLCKRHTDRLKTPQHALREIKRMEISTNMTPATPQGDILTVPMRCGYSTACMEPVLYLLINNRLNQELNKRNK